MVCCLAARASLMKSGFIWCNSMHQATYARSCTVYNISRWCVVPSKSISASCLLCCFCVPFRAIQQKKKSNKCLYSSQKATLMVEMNQIRFRRKWRKESGKKWFQDTETLTVALESIVNRGIYRCFLRKFMLPKRHPTALWCLSDLKDD